MKTSLLIPLTLVLGAAALSADVKVIQAFEGDGFDSWQTTGTAFGLAPIAGKVDGVNGEFRNYGGNALVCSGHGGDAATGTLTSPEIVLTHPFLGFLVAGGNHPGKTAVQLLVDGKVVPFVQETVLNTYVKDSNFDVAAADAYWAASKDYWAAVRDLWDAAIAAHGGVRVQEVAETGAVTGTPLMDLAEKVQSGEVTTAAAIDQVLTACGQPLTNPRDTLPRATAVT